MGRLERGDKVSLTFKHRRKEKERLDVAWGLLAERAAVEEESRSDFHRAGTLTKFDVYSHAALGGKSKQREDGVPEPGTWCRTMGGTGGIEVAASCSLGLQCNCSSA